VPRGNHRRDSRATGQISPKLAIEVRERRRTRTPTSSPSA